MGGAEVEVLVAGGGVVGCAVALELARRGVSVLLAEAEDGFGLQASGTNSGVLHTGFDSVPGELETHLILRAARPREEALAALGVPVKRCGALMTPRDDAERARVAALARGAAANGVAHELRDDGSLLIPGECVTDPVRFTLALAAAAGAAGAELRVGAPVGDLERAGDGLAAQVGGARVRARVVVNCAGLGADALARTAGDEGFAIHPRKGEFLVFEPPGGAAPERILLPVPSPGTKGVLVFPTLDGKLVTGPTAHDQQDKRDWRVRPEAPAEIRAKVAAMVPELEGAEPIAAYAGLRPAGTGCNYVIGPSPLCPPLIHVAAIRSTGLTAALGIAADVAGHVAAAGVEVGEPAPLRPGPRPPGLGLDGPWWTRTARYEAARAS
ncbi:MAG: FAD-dependent oxidoreductase [Solirubrobacteraceae bacterium]|nr:FAD-dependent oxidoreductase [Solirubrobacteraceae bacterium]